MKLVHSDRNVREQLGGSGLAALDLGGSRRVLAVRDRDYSFGFLTSARLADLSLLMCDYVKYANRVRQSRRTVPPFELRRKSDAGTPTILVRTSWDGAFGLFGALLDAVQDCHETALVDPCRCCRGELHRN